MKRLEFDDFVRRAKIGQVSNEKSQWDYFRLSGRNRHDLKEEINAFDPFATLKGSGLTQGMWGATNGADNW